MSLRKKSAAKAARNVHSVYGEDCVNERICRSCFAKHTNFTLEDEDRIGRPVEFNNKLHEKTLKKSCIIGNKTELSKKKHLAVDNEP